MKTIKKFNSDNFDVKIVDAENLNCGLYAWGLDLIVEVTDKETGMVVGKYTLPNRMVSMWETGDNWYDFVQEKIENGAELDEDLDYYDADEELQKEFDDMIEEQYIDCFFEEINEDYGYELDDEDLDCIFDGDWFVICDNEEVWFVRPRDFDYIGYNEDNDNDVYKVDEYIIEEIDYDEYTLRNENEIKIIKDSFEEMNCA